MPYIGKTPSQATRQRYYKTASGGETSLSGTMTTGGTLTFTDGNFVDVSVNGVALVAGTDYNTNTANTIDGLSALTANDQVEIIVYDTFSVFSGNVNTDFSVGGDLTVDTNTLFVDASANEVGIGTTTPATYTDYVSGSNAPAVVVAGSQPSYVLADTDISGNDGTLGITKVGEDTVINNLGAGSIKFYNNGGERITITSNGVTAAAGAASTPGYAFLTDTSSGMFLPAADTLAFSSGGTETVRIASGGTTTFTTSDASTIIHRVGTNVAGIKTAAGDDFCVGTADHTQAIRIKNTDGHVGIGNSAPSCQLHVNADDDDEVLQVHADSSSYTSNVIYVQTTKAANTDHRYFKANENDGSATSIQILGNGNVQNANGSYGSISDQRIKQDVTDANSQWADIKALNFKNYREKYRVSVDGDDAPVLLGLIAQDLETAGMNGLVETVEPDPYQKDTLGIEKDVKAVKYSILYLKAVKALQEAMTRIETLEAKVAALEEA